MGFTSDEIYEKMNLHYQNKNATLFIFVCYTPYFSKNKGFSVGFLYCFLSLPCSLCVQTILCSHVPGFHGQVFKQFKILSERSKKKKEQNKNKGNVPVVEPAYIF